MDLSYANLSESQMEAYFRDYSPDFIAYFLRKQPYYI